MEQVELGVIGLKTFHALLSITLLAHHFAQFDLTLETETQQHTFVGKQRLHLLDTHHSQLPVKVAEREFGNLIDFAV
jgi:hypothetical protein